jgi:hypothetical protein
MPVHKLPIEIRLFCIIPFTYTLQSRELMRDVRSYRVDMDILENVYNVQYNDDILLFDLTHFCTETLSCYDLWKRHFLYSQFSIDNIYDQISRFIYSNFHTSRKIRFLWGLLSPEERNEFINSYILS